MKKLQFLASEPRNTTRTTGVKECPGHGQDFDKESGLHALAHVRACCAFLIEYMVTHPELDDRFKKPEPIVPMATEAQFAEWAKNANALQQQTAEENEQVRHMLKSIACLDVGQSKSPPWLME